MDNIYVKFEGMVYQQIGGFRLAQKGDFMCQSKQM